MDLIYLLDYCFQQTPDAKVWTDANYSASFWTPYLSEYDEVVILCRINQVDAVNPDWRQVNADRIRVQGLPSYRGPAGYLRASRKITKQLDATFRKPGMIMLRTPSNLARCAYSRLKKMKRAYGVDVVGDPWHAMAPGVVRIRGRAFFRWLFTRSQKQICYGATGVTYVASTLPTAYPSHYTAKSLVCSDVRLPSVWIKSQPRVYAKPAVRLVTIATLTQMYKGIDILLRSLQMCRSRGFAFQLTIVGTGRHQQYLEGLATSLGVREHVEFRGSIAWGAELSDCLDRADLFVLPSLVEVMPRALLEAMARALPAIATRVGAVSHVLAQEDIVEPGNFEQLAHRLIRVAGDPERLTQMSRRNLSTACLHDEAVLLPRWMKFHRELSIECASQELEKKLRKKLADSSIPASQHNFGSR